MERWESPFLGLMECVRYGVYPPPDLLWAVYQNFSDYMHSDTDLESALIAPLGKGRSNFRGREHQHQERWEIAHKINTLMSSRGCTQDEASEILAQELGGNNVDPDSLKKQAQRSGALAAFPKKRRERYKERWEEELESKPRTKKKPF